MKSTLRNIEVLIVDDEIDICYLLTGILKKKNLHTAYVNTLQEANHILSLTKPSIVFLDNNLPDGYGVDFIKQIKKTDPLIKIIMITADDEIYKEKALSAGADLFIGKPFSGGSVSIAVDELIAEKIH